MGDKNGILPALRAVQNPLLGTPKFITPANVEFLIDEGYIIPKKHHLQGWLDFPQDYALTLKGEEKLCTASTKRKQLELFPEEETT